MLTPLPRFLGLDALACRRRRWRWLGDFLHPIGEGSEVRLLREVTQLFGGNRGTDVEMPCDVLQQLEYRRHLALGEQIDLQIEMSALVRLSRQPVLAREHEPSEEDRF